MERINKNSLESGFQVKFASKAETLVQLKNAQGGFIIPDFLNFSLHEWNKKPRKILEKISEHFLGKFLAIRSSALCEDSANKSFAGAFTTVLNIDSSDEKKIEEAVEIVFDSYPDKNIDDQILIQEMVKNIDISGVILTRCVDDGSPYYVLNYDDETGNTDSITSGKGSHKTVLVYRKFKSEYCDSIRVRKMLELAREIESFCGGVPLDIEFALDNSGVMYLLQLRRISTVNSWHPDTEYKVSRIIPHVEAFVSDLSARRKGLFGEKTIFGNMPDWNPAELIGVIPSPLAASLFRILISSHAWYESRALMGYQRIPKTELMVLIGGHAFIDVRASFNSFLPKGITEEIGEKLINAWIQRLMENPSLHDKVEFDVAQTVLDFSFDENFSLRYDNVLDNKDRHVFKSLLRKLTNDALDISKKGSLTNALSDINNLNLRQNDDYLLFDTDSPTALVAHIQRLVEDCLLLGTIPFSIIARHGFIAETLLRSAISRGAINPERVAIFKLSFHTIMGVLAKDTQSVCQGKMEEQEFKRKYGHLRPGTFDIMSPCYKDRMDLFTNCLNIETRNQPINFVLSSIEKKSLEKLLVESGITTVNAVSFLKYSQKAIQGREYAKFVFTRNLSVALESITRWGAMHNIGREELSFLTLQDILDTSYSSFRGETTTVLMHKVDRAKIDQDLARVFKLSYLVRGVRDIHVVPIHRSEPNFITQKNIECPCVFIQPTSLNYYPVKDCIVCIENADPGFDWIFTKGIAGLITKYGGANSHMAIRCSELHLPAAIGCGEELFERLKTAHKIELNCGTKTIRKLGSYE